MLPLTTDSTLSTLTQTVCTFCSYSREKTLPKLVQYHFLMVNSPALAGINNSSEYFYGKYQTQTCMYGMFTLMVTLFILLDRAPAKGLTESLVCHYYKAKPSYYYLMINA